MYLQKIQSPTSRHNVILGIGGILYHLGCRACTRGSACTKGRAGTTFQFCTSDGLIGVWCKHYLWCHPSGLIDLNEPLGSCTTWFMLHFFGACSKKDWYRIESGAWCKHQVVCGARCMAQNNCTEFHLLPHCFLHSLREIACMRHLWSYKRICFTLKVEMRSCFISLHKVASVYGRKPTARRFTFRSMHDK